MTKKTKTTNIRLTPEWLLALAREALGGSIDIDPCTEPENPTGATIWYTEREPAPDPWPPGTVWCNPPWGAGEIIRWARKAMTRPHQDPLVFMTPTDSRTEWFKYLKREADYLILITRSVRCYAPELEREVEPSRGVYLWTKGVAPEKLACFRDAGHVVCRL